MKLLRHIFQSAIFCGALLASAHAQLVHLAFTEGRENNMIFRADSVQIPWNHTGGYISRFDLWYDVANPTDPARNLWRADVFAHGLGEFEIIRPYTGLSFFYENLELNYANPVERGYETLQFTAAVTDPSFDSDLPIPPFTLNSYSLYLAGGSTYFDVPHFGYGYGNGAFDRFTATIEQSVVLNPVPEPSTYAFAGVAMLGLVALYAKRRKCSPGARRHFPNALGSGR